MNLLKDLEMENTKTVIDLSNLTLEELNKVIYDANRLIRSKELELRKDREEHATTMLEVGDVVELIGKKFKGELWEVLKLNPRKVKCKRENGETWNVPYSNILIS